MVVCKAFHLLLEWRAAPGEDLVAGGYQKIAIRRVVGADVLGPRPCPAPTQTRSLAVLLVDSPVSRGLLHRFSLPSLPASHRARDRYSGRIPDHRSRDPGADDRAASSLNPFRLLRKCTHGLSHRTSNA